MGGNMIETLMGAVVIIVAGVFLTFAYSTAEIRSVGGYQVSAEFDRIDGLTTGADVRLSGIKVGTVVEQTLNPQSYVAVVKMNINSDVKLPDDTSVKVTSEGLLGGNYLSLSPGGSEDYLEDGGQIEFAQGTIDLMSLISQAIFSFTNGGDSKSKSDTAE